MKSGIYTLQDQNLDTRLAYCDMSQEGYIEADLETPIGFIQASTYPYEVAFSVSRETGSVGSENDITFDTVIEDNANAFDPDTGIYVVPVSGQYELSTIGLLYCNNYGDQRVYLFINNRQDIMVLRKYSNSNGEYDSCTQTSSSHIVKLKKGDQIKLRVTQGSINGSTDYKIYFSGHLINEE